MSVIEAEKRQSSSFLHKIGYYLFMPYRWIIFVPILGSSTVFFTIPIMFFAMLGRPKTAGTFAMMWGRVNAWFGMMSVLVQGREHIDPTQSYIIVANHQSLFDILMVYGWLGIDFRWVMKQELRRVPVLGYACEKLEHIYIDRSNPKAAMTALRAAQSKIVGGTSIFFFPEGKRSDDGQLRKFKAGAFKIAIDMQLPILPITLVGTKAILPKGSFNLRPGKAKMIIHEPIPIDAFDTSDLDAFRQLAYERVASVYE